MSEPRQKQPVDWFHRQAELLSVLLMALATVATAWCAHQANLWSSRQTFKLADARTQLQRSAELALEAHQTHLLHRSIFLDFVRAKAEGEDELAAFYEDRLPSELKTAVDAWLRMNPLESPNAPLHPFHLPEYRIQEDVERVTASRQAARRRREAELANAVSDRYIFATVLFASVLLFAGLAPKLTVRIARLTLLALSAAVFVAGLILVLTLPMLAL